MSLWRPWWMWQIGVVEPWWAMTVSSVSSVSSAKEWCSWMDRQLQMVFPAEIHSSQLRGWNRWNMKKLRSLYVSLSDSVSQSSNWKISRLFLPFLNISYLMPGKLSNLLILDWHKEVQCRWQISRKQWDRKISRACIFVWTCQDIADVVVVAQCVKTLKPLKTLIFKFNQLHKSHHILTCF